MGKTGKWLKNFLVGSKKDRDKEKTKNNNVSVPENPTTPITVTPTTPKEKRRWSFRRSSASSPAAPIKGLNSPEQLNGSGSGSALFSGSMESESEQKKHALAVAAATAAAADAAVAAAQAAAAVIRLTAGTASRTNPFEEAAAIKIQSAYRAYLARKALRALRGLVKLQALVRGHLVRKQATATLRCMQALVTVQARARGQRIRMAEDSKSLNPRSSFHRKSTRDDRFKHTSHETERLMEENIKIVEMDIGESQVTAAASAKSRNSYSNHPTPERTDHRFSTHSSHSKLDAQQLSPAPSALTELSPRTCSGHFEEYNNCSFATVQSSPQCYSAVPRPETARMPPASYARSEYAESISYEYPLYPNYMANTESSRAKARSQSAPKQRPPEYFERQPSSRRRTSTEGRNTGNVPRAMRMQRSSSHVGSAVHNYQYPWSIKLDRSTVSLKESECGSTSTVLTNINYCRSLASYDITGNRYRSLPPPPPLPPTRAV